MAGQRKAGRREPARGAGNAKAQSPAKAAPPVKAEPHASATLSVSGLRLPWPRRRFAADLQALATLAATSARRPVRLDVAVLDDRSMARLHRLHLDLPGTTDVLSYALEDGPLGLVGALALGGAVARREALRRGHPPYHEALLYAVHGTLHLLGYDDHAIKDRARMRRAERAWLTALGLGDVFGDEVRSRRRRP